MNALAYFLLIWLAVIALAIAFMPVFVFAEHLENVDNYTLHPTTPWALTTVHEIHIMEVWVQPYEDYIPFEEDCAIGFELADDGSCTPAYTHWHIYPIRLVQEMPPRCGMHHLDCILDSGIYIRTGLSGKAVGDHGCSLLYHAILHLTLPHRDDPELQHDIMERDYNNERCAVGR